MNSSRRLFKSKLKRTKLRERQIFCEKLSKDIEEGHYSRFWSKLHGGLHQSKSNHRRGLLRRRLQRTFRKYGRIISLLLLTKSRVKV